MINFGDGPSNGGSRAFSSCAYLVVAQGSVCAVGVSVLLFVAKSVRRYMMCGSQTLTIACSLHQVTVVLHD